ncbi:MAG: hypothetical protein C4547_00130 [Phycisphaerales bacterium]|nr:MAG: hypothetical protein C4547_00130 [Phycisphaerales bacterium]
MISPLHSSGILSAQFSLQRSQQGLNATMTRLATGRRINSGKDDPAGLISSERLAAEIRALEAESKSIQRADANVNITEGHLANVSDMMAELKGLVVASSNTAGLSDAEIAANQVQIDSLVASIQRFGGEAVRSLDGFHMPDDGNAGVETRITDTTSGLASLVSGGSNALASGNFEAALAVIDQGITDVASARGELGAFQRNVLQPRFNSNQVSLENLMESRSRIADADYAEETSNLNKFEILTKSGMKVLKLAQQSARDVLSLLEG